MEIYQTKIFEANSEAFVKQTTDGGYIICGSTDYVLRNGSSDVYFNQNNINEILLWTAIFEEQVTTALPVQQPIDGRLYYHWIYRL